MKTNLPQLRLSLVRCLAISGIALTLGTADSNAGISKMIKKHLQNQEIIKRPKPPQWTVCKSCGYRSGGWAHLSHKTCPTIPSYNRSVWPPLRYQTPEAERLRGQHEKSNITTTDRLRSLSPRGTKPFAPVTMPNRTPDELSTR